MVKSKRSNDSDTLASFLQTRGKKQKCIQDSESDEGFSEYEANVGSSTEEELDLDNKQASSDNDLQKKKKRPYKDVKKNFKKILTRTNPKGFVNSLKTLNENQKKSIQELGFGSLLQLDIQGLPSFLSYYLVDCFDSTKVCLRFSKHDIIYIDEKDVELALGFPLGGRKLSILEKNVNSEAYDEWKKNFPSKGEVQPSMVAEKMKNEKDGGPMFKKCFFVLLISLLVESYPRGKANDKYIRCLESVDDISHFNWCGFVLDCLVEAKVQWDNEKKSFFNGSTLFLTLLYVDRVQPLRTLANEIQILRRNPIFLGWTQQSLKKREREEMESYGFGKGRLLERQSIDTKHTKCGGNAIPQQTNASTSHASTRTPIQEYVKKLTSAMEEASEKMYALSMIVRDIPIEFLNDAKVKSIHDTSMKLIGASQNEDENSMRGTGVEKVPESQDPFWQCPELLRCMEQIEKQLQMKAELEKRCFKPPSFSLGVEFDDWENVTKIAEAYEDGVSHNVSGNPSSSTLHTEQPKAPEEIGKGAGSQKEIAVEGSTKKVINTRSEKAGRSPSKLVTRSSDKVMPRSKVVFKKPTTPKKTGTTSSPPTKKVLIGGSVHQTVGPTQAVTNVPRRNQPKRDVDVGPSMKSPFNERAVQLVKLTTEESHIINFVYNTTIEANSVIFRYEDIGLTLHTMRCLKPGCFVDIKLIDAWTVFLNHNEKLRSVNSPLRFFFTTNTSFRTIIDVPPKYGVALDEFEKNVNRDLSHAPHMKLRDVDMVFFPMLFEQGYIVIVIDFKNDTFEIIDSRAPRVTLGDVPETNFEEITTRLKKIFLDYLGCHSAKKCGMLRSMDPTFICLPWATHKPNNDSAVYAMRHMETYMGGGTKSWKVGFGKKNNEKLVKLCREKYLSQLLNWKNNEVKDLVLQSIGQTRNI